MLLLHVDDHLIVVDKPAGWLSVPGRHEPDCMAARVQARWPDALVVHRLDMATSGLLVFARGAAAQRRLSMDFEARQVDKHYLAVVHGAVEADDGLIDLPLAADWPNRPRQQVDRQQGKPSTTRWQVLSRDPEHGTSRLQLQPITGRSHQLRVHLQAIGHPIVGDRLYGQPDPAQRLHLHASQLGLRHPSSDAWMDFNSPAPF